MTVLQTIALPLGYSAIRMARGRVSKADGGVCQYLDFCRDDLSGRSAAERALDGETDAVGRTAGWWRAGGHITRAAFLTDHALAPDFVAAVVVADEIAFHIDGRAAGGVAADVDAAGVMLACFGLGCCSEQGQGGDRERGKDCFHGMSFFL